jgi:hypothetical protein
LSLVYKGIKGYWDPSTHAGLYGVVEERVPSFQKIKEHFCQAPRFQLKERLQSILSLRKGILLDLSEETNKES